MGVCHQTPCGVQRFYFSKWPSAQLASYRQLSCGTVSILYVDALPGLVLTKFFFMKKIESSLGNLPGPRRTETDCATVGFSSAYVKL